MCHSDILKLTGTCQAWTSLFQASYIPHLIGIDNLICVTIFNFSVTRVDFKVGLFPSIPNRSGYSAKIQLEYFDEFGHRRPLNRYGSGGATNILFYILFKSSAFFSCINFNKCNCVCVLPLPLLNRSCTSL